MAEEGKLCPSRVVRNSAGNGRGEEKRRGKEKGRAPDAAQNAVVMLAILTGSTEDVQSRWSTLGGVILVTCSQ
jgi:hypothetical protein